MATRTETITVRLTAAQRKRVLEVARRLGSEGNASVGARWLITHAPIKRLPPVRTEAADHDGK